MQTVEVLIFLTLIVLGVSFRSHYLKSIIVTSTSSSNTSIQKSLELQYRGDALGHLQAALVPTKANKTGRAVAAVIATNQTKHTLSITPDNSIKSGEYTMTVKDNDAVVHTQTVLWGVLALNAEKSVYRPGEKAHVQMGVLGSSGQTICNGTMRLDVQHLGSGERWHYSTDDNTITRYDVCSIYAYHEVPDYDTTIVLPKTGLYTLVLSAVVEGKERFYTETVRASDSPDIIVSRQTVMRLYPPETYPMQLGITPKAAYTGEIYEPVPQGFAISPLPGVPAYNRVEQRGDKQVIVWKVRLKAYETFVTGYRYKSPNISPFRYTVGPITLPGAGLQEQRSWVIANDTASVTVSGTIYSDEGVTGLGSGRTVKIKVNGADACSGACTATSTAGGAYSIASVTITSGDVMTMWLSGGSEVGTTVTIIGTETAMSNMHIYQDRLVVRHENAGPITNTNLATWDNSNDSDMVYAVTSGALTTESGIGLYVWNANTFTPGGAVTTAASSVPASPGGDIRVKGTGTLSMGSNSLTIGGGLVVDGTLSLSSGQSTTFTGTASGHVLSVGSNSLENVIFSGTGGGWSFSTTTTINGDLTMTAGTLSGTANIAVLGGDITGNGTIATTGGTVTLDGTGNFGSDAAWSFAGLTFGDGVGASTTTSANTGAITISGSLTIAVNQTLAAGSRIYRLTASSSPFVVNGTFTANTSTISYDSTASTAIPVTSYYNLSFSPASGTPTYTVAGAGALTITNNLEIAGSSSSTLSLTNTITISGNMSIGANGTLSTSASVTVNGGGVTGAGTINQTAGTFTIDGVGNFGGAAGWTFYNLTIGDGTGTQTTTASGSATATVTNVLTIAANQTLLAGAKTYRLTKNGTPFVLSGTFTPQTSTISYGATTGTTTLTETTFYNLDMSPASGTPTYLFGTVNGSAYVLGNAVIGGAGAATFDAGTNNTNLDITGNLIIGSGHTFTASSSANLLIGGNFTNNGTYTAGTGTITFNRTTTSTLDGNNTIFYNFSVTTASKSIIFTAGQTFRTNGLLTLTGSAGSLITIDSTDPSTPTRWTLNHQGTEAITYASIKNSGCHASTTIITVDSATITNAGNNGTCWDFGAGNNAPASPTSLVQKKVTANTVLATSGWTNESQLKFQATVSDVNNPDTLYLCVEADLLGTAFSNTEDSCGTGVAVSGPPATASVTLTSMAEGEYHWQVRTKDAASAYSSWVSYGGNAESARDAGIDTTAPTSGVVYDGTTAGIDSEFNDGSLSSLSANWGSFNATLSGLSGYLYAIGTTPGGTDTLAYTSAGTSTSVTASSLVLQTAKVYYFSVRATDNAGNIATVNSDGQYVTPSLSFGVSPSVITFAALNSGNAWTDTATTTLTTSSNAYNGYLIRGYSSTLNTSVSGNTVPNFSGGSYATPGTWGVGTIGFGYTSSDTLVQGSNKFSANPCSGGGAPPCYAPFSQTAPGDIIADHTALVTGAPVTNEAFTITLKTVLNATHPAGVYNAVLIYTITAIY